MSNVHDLLRLQISHCYRPCICPCKGFAELRFSHSKEQPRHAAQHSRFILLPNSSGAAQARAPQPQASTRVPWTTNPRCRSGLRCNLPALACCEWMKFHIFPHDAIPPILAIRWPSLIHAISEIREAEAQVPSQGMFQPQLSGHFSHLCCAVVNFWLQRRRQWLPAATRPSQPPGIQKQLAIDISHGKVTASEMFRYRASESKMYDQWWQRVPPSDWRNSREVWSSSCSWGMKSSTLQEPFTDHPTCFQRGDIETLMRSALPRIHFSLPD